MEFSIEMVGTILALVCVVLLIRRMHKMNMQRRPWASELSAEARSIVPNMLAFYVVQVDAAGVPDAIYHMVRQAGNAFRRYRLVYTDGEPREIKESCYTKKYVYDMLIQKSWLVVKEGSVIPKEVLSAASSKGPECDNRGSDPMPEGTVPGARVCPGPGEAPDR